jgi:pyrroline-5-carboxylate reductase
MPAGSLLHDAPRRLWLVGCGAMGGALLSRWLVAGLDPSRVTVVDPAPGGLPARFEGAVLPDLPGALAGGPPPDLLVLAIKPQALAGLAEQVRPALAGDTVLVSMLAGVRVSTLAALFPGVPIARIMPNTPARIGRGISALYAPGLDAASRDQVRALLSAAGTVVSVDEETRFDAITALSGSGPAFLFRYIEAFAGAGEAAGLDPETAALLAEHTVVGAAALLAEGLGTPASLRQQVTSPNGTTQAGLDVLDGDGALSSLLRATVRAAAERSRALAGAAEAAIDAPSTREAQRA